MGRIVAVVASCTLAFAGLAGASTAQAGTPAQPVHPMQKCKDVPKLSKVTPEVADAVTRLDAVDYLAGDWVGSGWATTETGVETFDQQEIIRRTGAGEVLTVHGISTDPEDPSQVVREANATLTWDGEQYLWRALSEGFETTQPFTLLPDGWTWQIPLGPGMVVRYLMTTDDAQRTWHETGEITFDGGATWVPTLEMDLVKVCDAGRDRPRG